MNLNAKIYDRQSGNFIGRLANVLETIKGDGFPLPSDPENAEYSYTPFDGDIDDSISIYWQE